MRLLASFLKTQAVRLLAFLKTTLFWSSAAAVLVAVSVIIGVYYLVNLGYNYGWTGFGDYNSPLGAVENKFERAKTTWDWMQLLIVPGVLLLVAYFFNRAEKNREYEITERRNRTEREIAADELRENTLQTYLDRMTNLLLEKSLLTSEPLTEVRTVAKARTATAFRSLDKREYNDLKIIRPRIETNSEIMQSTPIAIT